MAVALAPVSRGAGGNAVKVLFGLGYSPLALRLAKEVIDAGADGPLQTGIELERKAYSLLRASHDFAEGVDAYVNKRKPVFNRG